MLFTSPEFFIFLAVTVAGFLVLYRFRNTGMVLYWLLATSLFFYGWWEVRYLILISVSICLNYAFALALTRRRSLPILIIGLVFNLGLIGYFKYANFFMDVAVSANFISHDIGAIALPLAISFFTFQQIAYIVDVYRGRDSEASFVKYALFVVFFPQLIAGPIVHYKETIPQLNKTQMFDEISRNIAVGVTYFSFGLFKKIVIADGAALYSTPVFDAVHSGASITFIEAWGASIAYTFQIYFDFSGYSDMAIGLARLFGVKLPINFDSPYKATSIIDFWRRWHITLSRFLRDYLYIPLGGGRNGQIRRYLNILTVMLLGGLWHGAGWTFILWGAIHAALILINHAYNDIRHRLFPVRTAQKADHILRFTKVAAMFVVIVIVWVPFRSESIEGSFVMLRTMAGLDGIVLPPTYAGYLQSPLSILGIIPKVSTLTFYDGVQQIGYMAFLLIVVWGLPNTHQFMCRFEPALDAPAPGQLTERFLFWRPNILWAVVLTILNFVSFFMIFVGRQNEFLYFQF
jgi:D-alanyl-lipoteichoic acid acyltransferase DltB (MBOAT superfamily)